MSKVIFVMNFCLLLTRIEAEINEKNSLINFHGSKPVQINKVSLTQKGYIQFLRYLADIPPIEDFTFCIWLKSSNLTYAHPLLSYSRHETDRFIRAWVTPHGEEVKLAIREKEIFSVSVNLQEHQWYHICPSWSSKTGHWDLFIDGKLKAHGFREKARGIVLPKHGDLVVGQEYTDFDKGLDDGIEGDIFGFNMVLSSTAPKGQSLSKVPFRFAQRRRISPLERRMDAGFIVSSPTLMLRRKSRKIEGEINLGENITPNINRNISYEDITIDNSANFDISTEEYSLSNEESSSRRKRQSFFGTPISYSNFNFGPKPVYRPEPPRTFRPESYQRTPYTVRHSYPVAFMAPPSPPPRKTSRIANDIVPFNSVNQKTLGLQLVELSFNCALGKGAPLKNVLISWTKTPVRVFGGAILKKGDPFCIKTDFQLH